MDKINTVVILSFLGFSAIATAQLENQSKSSLSLVQAIKTAQKNDPWLTGNSHQQKAIESMSQVANTLPDPMISLGLANLPTDSFDFSQEGMTQAKVAIAQRFPRGDTLILKSQQLKMQSEAYPFQRENRQAQVEVTVGSLWLDAYRVQQSIALIENNRSLFEQLADVAQASYSTNLGKTRQQDLVRAQLELTRLDDRLEQLAQQKNRYEGMLFQWLTKFSIDGNLTQYSSQDFAVHNLELSEQLPQIELVNRSLINAQKWLQPQELVHYFTNHPAVVAIDKKVSATQSSIKLAQQKYQPEWGVNASYGYREDDPMGNNRADLFSIGVTFDLPIFTENKQDKEVQSAISQTEAVKSEKLLLLRELLGSYASAKGRLVRLKERQNLYKSKLLPQIQDQAEASLTAYTNDDGDFSEVVRSRIAVLNAQIDELTLSVEEQKLHLELNYLFIGHATSVSQNNSHGQKFKTSNLNFTNHGQYVVNREESHG